MEHRERAKEQKERARLFATQQVEHSTVTSALTESRAMHELQSLDSCEHWIQGGQDQSWSDLVVWRELA